MQFFAPVFAAFAAIGIWLITFPAATALSSGAADRWHFSQSTDQSAAAAPSGSSEQEIPSTTEDGTPATVIDDREVEGILGKSVRRTGHFNLAQGTVGTAVGIGASLSTILAGYAYDHFGLVSAFLGLAGLAGAGFLAVLAFMPETDGVREESNEFRHETLLP